MSQTQQQLWPIFIWAVGELKEYAKDDEILVGHNGDITHGDRYSGYISDTTREDQRIIAYDNLLPLVELPNVKKAVFLTGTEVHVPENSEARVAARLMENLPIHVECSRHARIPVSNGDIIDAAHHGPSPGIRDWTRGNVARLYLQDRMYKDRRVGKRPARLYLRGHYHQYVHVTVNDFWEGEDTAHDLVIVPALSGVDSFIDKVGKTPPILQAGMVAFEFIEGRMTEVKPFVQEIDLRSEVRL